MRAHYRSTLDFSDAGLRDAKTELDRFYRAIAAHPGVAAGAAVPESVLAPLLDDLNTPGAIAGLHSLANAALAGDARAAAGLLAAGNILGLFNMTPAEWFRGGDDHSKIDSLIAERKAARAAKNFARADEIRDVLKADGIVLEDVVQNGVPVTHWRREQK
jgi:cysteinyl-tRNA synthetase